MKELEQFLERNFDMTLQDGQKELEDSYFVNLLAGRIEELIDKNFGKLVQILYRIDVPDRETAQAFSLGVPSQISRALATLIIERQMAKLRYRKSNLS